MSAVSDIKKESVLVSGGCDKDGLVPFSISLLRKLKQDNKRINVHPGLVSEERARFIGRYADVVSFDFVSDTRVIHDNYNLEKTEQDFIDSFLWLKKYARVMPHIMVGLGNESRSIEILKKLKAEEACMLILMKHSMIKNELEEPSLEYIENILKKARKAFKVLHFGCMRPLDRKKEIDPMAVKYVDSIVNPYHRLDLNDYRIIKKDVCCSFS